MIFRFKRFLGEALKINTKKFTLPIVRSAHRGLPRLESLAEPGTFLWVKSPKGKTLRQLIKESTALAKRYKRLAEQMRLLTEQIRERKN